MSRTILTVLFVSALELSAITANAEAIFNDDPLRPHQVLVNRPYAEGSDQIFGRGVKAFGVHGVD